MLKKKNYKLKKNLQKNIFILNNIKNLNFLSNEVGSFFVLKILYHYLQKKI